MSIPYELRRQYLTSIIDKEDNVYTHTKGIYLKYLKNKSDIKTNIYSVANLGNSFLGVHSRITNDGSIKIAPTVILAFWIENSKAFDNFSFGELTEILYYKAKLFILNSFNFRNLAIEEMKNYNKKIFIQKAKDIVYNIECNFKTMPVGIRAQLLSTNINELVQDFILEHTKKATYILNAVSPVFTSSFTLTKRRDKKYKDNL